MQAHGQPVGGLGQGVAGQHLLGQAQRVGEAPLPFEVARLGQLRFGTKLCQAFALAFEPQLELGAVVVVVAVEQAAHRPR